MPNTNEQSVEDVIPSNAYEQNFRKWVDTEWMRQKIISVLLEEIDKYGFANKIKKYAAEEMDKRVFTSVKYWVIVILSSVITAGIGFSLAKLF